MWCQPLVKSSRTILKNSFPILVLTFCLNGGKAVKPYNFLFLFLFLTILWDSYSISILYSPIRRTDSLVTFVLSNLVSLHDKLDISYLSYTWMVIFGSRLISCHCLRSVQIWGFFWSLFSCIRTEYRKIRARKTSVFGHFSLSVLDMVRTWNDLKRNAFWIIVRKINCSSKLNVSSKKST